MTTTAITGTSEEEPAPKRVKTTTTEKEDDDDIAFLSEFIQQEILTRQEEFQVDFAEETPSDDISSNNNKKDNNNNNNNKQPYPHVIIPNLLHEDFAQQVQTQVKQHSQVNFKESDLFRVYQSIDLANLQEQQQDDDDDDDNTKDDAAKETTNEQSFMKMSIDSRKIPAVLKLRRLLYSTAWRHFVERLVGLPINTLTEEVDCAFNCHAPGCHLLCHDDVIGTRKVSYILYLTDHPSSSSWTAADGGALELYGPANSDQNNDDNNDKTMIVPATIPSKVYLPLWNHMAFFVVEPGVSFHAVQEVLGERPRLSLQGWYHYHRPTETAAAAAAADDDEDNNNEQSKNKDQQQRPLATLEQLKQGRQKKKDDDKPYLGESSEGPFIPIVYPDTDGSKNVAPTTAATAAATVNNNDNDDDDDDNTPRCRELSLEDGQYLSKFLNPTYLSPKSMQDICKRFVDDSSVQLRNFLSHKYIDQIDAARRAQEDQEASANQKLILSMHDNPNDLIKYYQQGTSSDECWKLVGPSHKQRFLEYNSFSATKNKTASSNNDTTTMGEIMHELRRDLLEHVSFHHFLACLTNLSPPIAQRGRIRRFRKGLDYTVAHYGLLLDKPILDATLCFVEGAAAATTSAAAGAVVNGDNSDDDDSDDEDQDDQDEEDNNPTLANEADAIWQSGDCGGFECYIEADDEDDDNNNNGKSKNNNEAFAEYNAGGGGDDDDTDLLSVSASNNTLSLVYRDPGTMRFVKYVGSRAPSSRWDVAMEYLGEDPEDNDNDEEQE